MPVSVASEVNKFLKTVRLSFWKESEVKQCSTFKMPTMETHFQLSPI